MTMDQQIRKAINTPFHWFLAVGSWWSKGLRRSSRNRQPKTFPCPISKMWSSTVSTVPEHCLVVTGGIVLLKQVCSEVTIEVAPYGVDVVGVVLRVVELDQE